jgi:hypothetical protein
MKKTMYDLFADGAAAEAERWRSSTSWGEDDVMRQVLMEDSAKDAALSGIIELARLGGLQEKGEEEEERRLAAKLQREKAAILEAGTHSGVSMRTMQVMAEEIAQLRLRLSREENTRKAQIAMGCLSEQRLRHEVQMCRVLAEGSWRHLTQMRESVHSLTFQVQKLTDMVQKSTDMAISTAQSSERSAVGLVELTGAVSSVVVNMTTLVTALRAGEAAQQRVELEALTGDAHTEGGAIDGMRGVKASGGMGESMGNIDISMKDLMHSTAPRVQAAVARLERRDLMVRNLMEMSEEDEDDGMEDGGVARVARAKSDRGRMARAGEGRGGGGRGGRGGRAEGRESVEPDGGSGGGRGGGRRDGRGAAGRSHDELMQLVGRRLEAARARYLQGLAAVTLQRSWRRHRLKRRLWAVIQAGMGREARVAAVWERVVRGTLHRYYENRQRAREAALRVLSAASRGAAEEAGRGRGGAGRGRQGGRQGQGTGGAKPFGRFRRL